MLAAGIILILVGLALMAFSGYLIKNEITVAGHVKGAGAQGGNSATVDVGGPLGIMGLGLVALVLGVVFISFHSGKSSSTTSTGAVPGPARALSVPPTAPVPTLGTAPPGTTSPSAPAKPDRSGAPAPTAAVGPPPYALTASDGSMHVVVESAVIDRRNGLLTFRVRVENDSTSDSVYLQIENVLAVDQQDRSFDVSSSSSTLAKGSSFGSISPGETAVGTVVLAQVLPPEDTGTVLELRFGFGSGKLNAWTFKTLVPTAPQ